MPIASQVSVQVRTLNDKTSILDIRGEVNSASENALMEAYTRATESGARVLLLNLQGLEYMNSSGIGLLVTLLIRANRQGQRLFAYGLSDHYKKIFDLTRLGEAIRIFNSEAEAIAAA